MNKSRDPLSGDSPQVEPFDERVAILAEELELAIQFDRPSILIAVYESEFVLQAAQAALSERLSSLGQRVYPFRVTREQFDIALLLSQHPAREASVFFVTGLKWGGGKGGDEAYRALNLHREYFVENQIRAVLWLTQSEAIDLPKHAPDFWAFRHRVVEFNDAPAGAGEDASLDMPAWGDQKTEAESHQDLDGRIAFRETSLAGLPEGDASQAARLDLFYNLAHLYWAKGDYERSIQRLQTGLKIAERMQDSWLQARFWIGLGMARAALKQADQAVEADEHAIQLQPEDPLPWSNLAAHCRSLGQLERAMQACQRAIGLRPARAEPWNNLGNIYRDLGRLEEAQTAYRSATRLAPGDPRPWINLGKVCVDQGRPREAIRAFRKAARAAPQDAEPWTRLGRVYQGLGRNRDALKAFETAVALSPGDAAARAALAELIPPNRRK
ncbi:MAG: tetratricopeptide repeat protein [Anaerolineales bacterium]